MLTWLFREDLLCEFVARFSQWLESLGKAAHDYDVDGFFDDIEECRELIEIDGREVDVEKLASQLCELHASILSAESDGELLEPLWIAESLNSWSDNEQANLTTDAGEIFLSNWKFDKSMRADAGPMLAFVAHLREVQLIPDSLTYAQLLLTIDKTVSGVVSVDVVIRCLSQQGIEISFPFLSSILRNEPRYLLIHSEAGLCVSKANQSLRAWELAAALFEPTEYLRSNGLAFDGKSYWQATYQIDFSKIKRFFEFHQRDISWNRFDLLEICLKLSHFHAKGSRRIQGVPAAVHRFIVDWIVKNRRVWRTDDSERILGRSFEFNPEDVPPGRLMVYGRPEPGRIGSGALVIREMVSRGKQLPGLIHSSRVFTPFEEVTVAIETAEVESLLLAQPGFAAWGITHIDDLAEHLLRKRGQAIFPYTLKLARVACTEALPQTTLQVGRGLLVALPLSEIVTDLVTGDQKRKRIVDHLFAQGISRRQIPEQLSARATKALLG